MKSLKKFALTLCAMGALFSAASAQYSPFDKEAYMTSSFAENRGTRYHAGFDYSTQMEEGWAVYAPEDGFVKELKVSPYGYGKVMFYQGNSGKIWVFAHQSSFGPHLDSLVFQKMYASKKNDVSIKPGTKFSKGDTLTFAGSSGIGNPHLHLEVRLDNDRVINPGLMSVAAADTMEPQIFGAAVWQGNDFAVTSAEAVNKGCIVTPVKNEFGLNLALKIVDYSREPKENPMSIRRIELWRYDEKVYSKIQDTLNFKQMIKIRDELLWTEEADTAGDWHYINAKLAPLSTYTLEVEDFAGHVIKKKFTFHPTCKNNEKFPQTKVQNSPVYTFVGKTMLDLYRCENGHRFAAKNGEEVLAENLCDSLPHEPIFLGKIAEIYPTMTSITYSAGADVSGDGTEKQNTIAIYKKAQNQTNVNWTVDVDGATIGQKISGAPVVRDTTPVILAVIKNHTDSLDYFEFHPKGLQFKGKWEVCIDSKTATAPLYWLGETSRDWFIFSKQTNGKNRCASTNELRDISWIDDKEAPKLGFAYWSNTMMYGNRQPVLKIPVEYSYAGLENGDAITVKYGKKWIAAEYDSEPREIIIEGERLPDAGEEISIDIVDEAKNKAHFDITIPEL